MTPDEVNILLQVERDRPVTLLRGLKRRGLVRFRESLGQRGQVLLLGPVELTPEGETTVRAHGG